MQDSTIYLKADKCCVVSNRRVYLEDIARMYGTDKKQISKLNRITALNITEKSKTKYSVSVLKVIELIHESNPSLQVENIGEADFILEYIPPSSRKKAWEVIKAAFVCITVFFGAFFTIMTFNEDVNVKGVFELMYGLLAGGSEKGNGLLEIGYAVGLALGICVFYNHILRKKIDSDPTPLQIQLRIYEENLEKTIIKNAERENKTIDV